MGLQHIRRQRHALSLIEGGRYDTSETKLVCFSGAGFSPALREAATAGDVVLVNAEDLLARLPPLSRVAKVATQMV